MEYFPINMGKYEQLRYNNMNMIIDFEVRVVEWFKEIGIISGR